MPTSLFGSSSQKIQIGIIGTGFRGQWVSQLLLNRPDVDVPVICDIDDIMIGKVLKVFEKANRPMPKIYKDGPEDFRNMVSKEDLDGVYIPAFNKSLKHLAYSYKKKFKIIGSAHNLKEIRVKETQNVQSIVLSLSLIHISEPTRPY